MKVKWLRAYSEARQVDWMGFSSYRLSIWNSSITAAWLGDLLLTHWNPHWRETCWQNLVWRDKAITEYVLVNSKVEWLVTFLIEVTETLWKITLLISVHKHSHGGITEVPRKTACQVAISSPAAAILRRIWNLREITIKFYREKWHNYTLRHEKSQTRWRVNKSDQGLALT